MTFFVLAMLYGVVLIIYDIHTSVRRIEETLATFAMKGQGKAPNEKIELAVESRMDDIATLLKSIESLLGQHLSAQGGQPLGLVDRPSELQLNQQSPRHPKNPEDRRRALLSERLAKANQKIDIEGYKAFGSLVDDASRNGNADARFHLGELYRDGHVVLKNIEEAIYWFDLAVQAGHRSAADELNRLRNV